VEWQLKESPEMKVPHTSGNSLATTLLSLATTLLYEEARSVFDSSTTALIAAVYRSFWINAKIRQSELQNSITAHCPRVADPRIRQRVHAIKRTFQASSWSILQTSLQGKRKSCRTITEV